MRNLKKILALVLALVMSLSLVTVANAAYSDEDSIGADYKEAVDVLTNLGVFRGTSSSANTFEPTKTITRAEVAAILYRISTGDVDDSEATLYRGYNYFTDSIPSWAEPYVGYCANAEIYKGVGKNQFAPNREITGYEVLATILRALGYDKNGEFTGSQWRIQTAATAEKLEITKGISSTQLAQPAERQLVAKLLLRAMLCDTVTYNAIKRDYDKSGKSLAYDTFEMEKVTGVVTGNEYADLTAGTTLAAGTTRIETAAKAYSVNAGTTLVDIGKTMYTYVVPDKTTSVNYDYKPLTSAIQEEAGQNTMYDDGVYTTVADAAKGKNMTTSAATKYYINYDPATSTSARTANVRMEYVIEQSMTEYAAKSLLSNGGHLYAGSGVVAANEITLAAGETSATWNTTTKSIYTYTKQINAFTTLNDTDYGFIRDIFVSADRDNTTYIKGEVYVYTTSVRGDVSDYMTFTQFESSYVTGSKTSDATITANYPGNRLIVIDNNKDGVADYVLQTLYCVGIVANVSSAGAITLDTPETPHAVSVNNLSGKTVVNDGTVDLAVGNVVTYAVIDGKARAELAENVTIVINTVNRVDATCTTADGDTYDESYIDEHSAGLQHGVINLHTGTSYTLYLDRYGNLAAFTESTDNGGLVLLVDGWHYATVSGTEYYVRAYIDGTIQTVPVTTNGSLFVNRNAANQNSWDQMRQIAGVNNDATDVLTAMAYLKDGALTPVDQLYQYSKQQVVIATNGNAIPGTGTTMGTVYTTNYRNIVNDYAYNYAAGTADVRALSNTVYYVVYVGPNGNTVVRQYVGYANVPSVVKNSTYIEDVYAVGTAARNASGTIYYTADAVVIEMGTGYQWLDAEQVFIAEFGEVSSNLLIENVQVIHSDGTLETVKVDLYASAQRGYDNVNDIDSSKAGLYYMSPISADTYVIWPMTAEQIRDTGRYAVGFVNRNTATGPYDYTTIDCYTNTNIVSGVAIQTNPTITPVGEAAFKNVADSDYYKLSYDAYDYATLSVSDRVNALAQDVDTSFATDLVNNDKYNEWATARDQLNEVLIAYNAKGEIEYAVSFAEYYTYLTTTQNRNAAQYVWGACLPAGTAPAASTRTLSYTNETTGVITNAYINILNADGTTAKSVDLTVDATPAIGEGKNALVIKSSAEVYVTVKVGDATVDVTKEYLGVVMGVDLGWVYGAEIPAGTDDVTVTVSATAPAVTTRTLTIDNTSGVDLVTGAVAAVTDTTGANAVVLKGITTADIPTEECILNIAMKAEVKLTVDGTEVTGTDMGQGTGMYLYEYTIPAGTDAVAIVIAAAGSTEPDTPTPSVPMTPEQLRDELVPPADGDYANGQWYSPTLDKSGTLAELAAAIQEYVNSQTEAPVTANAGTAASMTTTIENLTLTTRTDEATGEVYLVLTYDIVIRMGDTVVGTTPVSNEKEIGGDEPDPTEAVEAALKQAEDALAADPQVKADLEAAQTALTEAAALEGVTDEQKAEIEAAQEDVAAAIEAIEEVETAVADAVAAADAAVASGDYDELKAAQKQIDDVQADYADELTTAQKQELAVAEVAVEDALGDTEDDALEAIVQAVLDAKDAWTTASTGYKKGEDPDKDEAYEAAKEALLTAARDYLENQLAVAKYVAGDTKRETTFGKPDTKGEKVVNADLVTNTLAANANVTSVYQNAFAAAPEQMGASSLKNYEQLVGAQEKLDAVKGTLEEEVYLLQIGTTKAKQYTDNVAKVEKLLADDAEAIEMIAAVADNWYTASLEKTSKADKETAQKAAIEALAAINALEDSEDKADTKLFDLIDKLTSDDGEGGDDNGKVAPDPDAPTVATLAKTWDDVTKTSAGGVGEWAGDVTTDANVTLKLKKNHEKDAILEQSASDPLSYTLTVPATIASGDTTIDTYLDIATGASTTGTTVAAAFAAADTDPKDGKLKNGTIVLVFAGKGKPAGEDCEITVTIETLTAAEALEKDTAAVKEVLAKMATRANALKIEPEDGSWKSVSDKVLEAINTDGAIHDAIVWESKVATSNDAATASYDKDKWVESDYVKGGDYYEQITVTFMLGDNEDGGQCNAGPETITATIYVHFSIETV